MLNLKRVNILLGNNNSSKSSALEAVMILMGASKPTLPLELNANRNYNGVSKDDILLFFHDLQTIAPIALSADFHEYGNRILKIEYFESLVKRASITDVDKGEVGFPRINYGLRYNYIDDGKSRNKSVLTVEADKGEISVDFSEKNPMRKTAVFVAPRYNFNDFIKHFNQIVTDKEKGLVLDMLINVEPTIKDIIVVGDKVMADTGLQKLVPINVLGDGIRKMFTLMTAMYSVKDGILVIDEVDNGLYYKSMGTLWKALLKTARQLNTQLFISTHSIDSLNALNDTLNDGFRDSQEEVNIYTLRRGDEGDIAVLDYDYEKFSYLLSREVEIR